MVRKRSEVSSRAVLGGSRSKDRDPPACSSLDGHQLDSTVLRSTFWRLVGRDEIRLAVTVRYQAARGNSLLDEIIDHCLRPALRQSEVVIFAADRVAVAVHIN